ncbi:Pre-mRNA cleavage complex 2 protein Pcf11 [Dictyocoela muelleri]|nr:Pre-mRNA cleavage complex 2 protein Pcf11 [Dictyocoela muelleri]
MIDQIKELEDSLTEINKFESGKVELAIMLCEGIPDLANEIIDFLSIKSNESEFEWVKEVKKQLIETTFANDLLLIPPPEAYFFKLIDVDEYFKKAKIYFKSPETINKDFENSENNDHSKDYQIKPQDDSNDVAIDLNAENNYDSKNKKLKNKGTNHKILNENITNKRKSDQQKLTKRVELAAKENILYQPIQCKNCGLRFSDKNKDEFTTHLEEHKRIQRALENTVISREYFLTKKEEKKKIPIPTITPEINKIVCDGCDNTCAVCSEKLDVIWDDEIENWIFKNAIEVDGDFCHRECID